MRLIPASSLFILLLLQAPFCVSTLLEELGSVYMPPAAGPNWPGAMPLDVNGYPSAPPELELEQVHVYVRHGERAPVGIRMNNPPASIPDSWTLCKAARRFKAAVNNTVKNESGTQNVDSLLPVMKVVERPDGSIKEGECLLGELTDVGRQTTYQLGQALRELYVDRLGFLSDTMQSTEEIYLRTTNVPRTTESLEQVLHGLYPKQKQAEGIVPLIRVRNGKDENLIGNTLSCKRLELLQIGFAQAAAATWNQTLEPLDKKLSKYINGNPIRLDGKPRASGILDTVRAAIAHGIHVPPEFKEKAVLDVIERAVVQEWFSGYKTEEVRRLGMGRLLSDLSRKMSSKAENGVEDPVRLLIHSTHDTGLAALMSTLDVYDERWPAFTASLTFELFRKRNPADLHSSPWQTVLSPFKRNNTQHYVRLRYQNRTLTLPACEEAGRHLPGSPEFCTLKAFIERARELIPADWEAECNPVPRT